MVLHDQFVRRHFPQTLLLAREAIAWGPTYATLTKPISSAPALCPGHQVEHAPWHDGAAHSLAEHALMWDVFVAPFIEDAALRRALVATLALGLSAGPVGIFLMLRRMSLAGDSLSHGVLPGVAVAYLLSGLAAIPMTIGGLVAGLVVALGSGFVTRVARQREDISFAAFYLMSLALDVLLVSLRGEDLELEHVLFGDILHLSSDSLLVIGLTSTISIVGMSLIWRPLVLESLDPGFLRSVSVAGRWAHLGFLVLVVLNLVGAFQASARCSPSA